MQLFFCFLFLAPLFLAAHPVVASDSLNGKLFRRDGPNLVANDFAEGGESWTLIDPTGWSYISDGHYYGGAVSTLGYLKQNITTTPGSI
jgi:hypothetical protein